MLKAGKLIAALRRWSVAKGNPGDAAALRKAAVDLDRLWRLDAAHGARDSLGGVEYQRLSHAPRLRSMADKIDSAGASA